MGIFEEGSFQAVQEYFQRKSCRFCDRKFAPDGIRLLREEPGSLVVKIDCSTCGKPLGVAIVGTTCHVRHPGRRLPIDWTRKDSAKLSNTPAISYDDVLAAHEFFTNLGTDWTKYIPQLQSAHQDELLDNHPAE